MQLPLRVNCRDLPHFPSLDAEIRRLVNALERLVSDVVDCEVTLASAAHHGLPGVGYVVDVDLRDGQAQPLVKSRQAHDDLDAALRLAFGAAARAWVGRCHALSSGLAGRAVAQPPLPLPAPAQRPSAGKQRH